MNIKKFLSILLACLLAVSLLPSAAAIDYALYADSAASVRSEAPAPAADAGPRSFMTAAVDEAEQDGAAFHPYVFTVDENASVSASVRMQPALMAFSPAGAPNSQKGAAKGGPDRELSSMTVNLDSEYPFGATVPINVTVTSGSNGTVTVTVRCEDHLESHTETVTDGIMTLYFSGTCAGPHNVTATYSGNEQFLPCSDTTAFTVLDDGDGGLFTPFRIGNAAQLEHFRDVVNAGRSDACAVLTSDIDLGDAAWTPIGYFTGWLDGAGHVISGLHVSAENNSGLFAEIYGGMVERLGVKGSVSATWSSGNDACAGGIAAGIFNETIISGCWFNGTVAASSKDNRYAYAGGIAGHITDDAAIQDCFTDCTVHAESDSENSAGAAQAGGIVGFANGGSVSFCYHTGGGVTIDGYREVPEASPPGNADGIGTIVGSVTECYYLDGTASSVTGVPLTAAQFNQTDSFFVVDSNSKTWNFDEVWYLNEAEGRPMLWEASSIDLELEDSLSSGQNLNINATVSSADATGLIELIIYNEDGSKTHSLEVENGKAHFFSDPFSGGRYYLTANYDGGKRFLPCMARGSFQVEDSWSCLQQDIESGNPVKLLTNVTCTEHEQSRGPIVIPENANVTIDLNGFTIDRGLTDAAVNGSVIYVGRNASLIILDSVGTGSINGGNTTGGGGAIQVAGGGKLTVSNVTFINNTAALYGGAIFGNKTAQIILNNSTFSGNRAAQGGAIYASDDTRLSISDCSFVNNTASYFGAIHMPIDGAVVNRSSFIRNTSEDFSGVIGSAWDSPGSCTITNCILLGNNVDADPIDFAAEEGKSADSNWFGSTAENSTVNPDCKFADAWNYINFTRAIDNATGQYAFGAELWLYNSTSAEATEVAPGNYSLPEIRLAGFTEGAEISTGGALMLSQAGYVSAAFAPLLNTTSYTVGFVYPGITGLSEQLTFNRTIRVNVGEGQNLTYNRTAPKTESVQALENGEAVPNAVLAGKTLTISIGDQNHTFTLAGDGSFLMDLGNLTPGTHEIALFVPGFAPSVTEIVGAKLFTPIDVEALASVFVGEEVLITVTLNENATGNVTLNVRNETAYNESFNATIHDGSAALSIDGLAAGTYTVNATYVGDDNYLPNTTIATFAVLPLAQYAVSVSADPAGGGTVSGTGNYTPGSTVTVTAQPQPGYDFVSWTDAGAVVSENATYAFTAEKARELVAGFVKKTFLISFLNYDGSELLNATVAYGETPQYTGQTPVKPATDAKTFTFTGWEPAISSVTGPRNYTAVFSEADATYTIRFLNYDGSELLNATVAYGQTPQYTGQTPVKPATDAKTFAFTGWEPAISSVTGPKNYTAVFSDADATYLIRFLNYDGSGLLNATVAYGQTPQYTGQTPVKPEDAQYTYSFIAWSPEIVPVNGAATYTATFNATAKTPQYYDWTPPAETRFDVVYTDNGGSLSNFNRVRTYNDGIFTDVDPEGWYYENVAAAYEFSLMDGTADEIFGVGKYLKLSETLALACRLHNIYYGGSGSFDQTKDKAWYTVYEDYAVRYGIIVRGQYDLTENATRAQFAEIISAALPEEALKAINDVKTLPDMDAGDPRLPAVLQLYNAGILTGTDDKGTFRPDALILREQAAAMMTRVSDPELRQTFVLAPDLP